MAVRRDVIPWERLPEGFAERVENPPDDPPRPRPAATIALLRPAGGSGDAASRDPSAGEEPGTGLEVLLLRRSRSSGFVPGAYVFPGGTVDRDDASDEHLARLAGLDGEQAGARLDLRDADPPAVAYYIAALREAFEETGILVGRTRDGDPPPTAADDPEVERGRLRILEDEDSFPEVLDRIGCTMDGRSVAYIAHWITPVAEPRRYDTRFFAAAVPPDAPVRIDRREMTDALWVSPARALALHERGELPMIFPTVRTLESLREFGSPDEALATFRNREIPTIRPELVRTPEGVASVIPEEG